MDIFITSTPGIIEKQYDTLLKAEGQADYLLNNYPGIEVKIYRRNGPNDYLIKTLQLQEQNDETIDADGYSTKP